MNRCLKTFPVALSMALAGLATVASVALPLNATAQTSVRTFPEKALRGKLVVELPPVVTLNGQADRLSPGARIHGTNNLLLMSGGLVGQALIVNYLRDGAGLIHEVWLLTPAEAALKRPAPIQ